jgi:hypothetical protein
MALEYRRTRWSTNLYSISRVNMTTLAHKFGAFSLAALIRSVYDTCRISLIDARRCLGVSSSSCLRVHGWHETLPQPHFVNISRSHTASASQILLSSVSHVTKQNIMINLPLIKEIGGLAPQPHANALRLSASAQGARNTTTRTQMQSSLP